MNNQAYNPQENVTKPIPRASGQQQFQPRQHANMFKVVIVFVLDATESMTNVINGVKSALLDFVDTLAAGQLSPQLGLIVFRDELIEEMPELVPPSSDVSALRSKLARTKADGGGDPPESSLPALMRAIEMMRPMAQDVTRIILHITDAPPHDPEAGHTAKSVLAAMKRENVIYNACTPADEPYKQFANETRGLLIPLESGVSAKDFSKVMAVMARQSILQTIPHQGPLISPEVQAILDGTKK